MCYSGAQDLLYSLSETHTSGTAFEMVSRYITLINPPRCRIGYTLDHRAWWSPEAARWLGLGPGNAIVLYFFFFFSSSLTKCDEHLCSVNI